jgi:hypothetical protein
MTWRALSISPYKQVVRENTHMAFNLRVKRECAADLPRLCRTDADDESAVKAAAEVGPGVYCPPHHTMPLNSRHELSKCGSSPRHGMLFNSRDEGSKCDIACHAMGCHLAQETTVQHAILIATS